jgi:hypothetical protein
MAPKNVIPTSCFVVGTHNSNGEQYSVFNNRYEAETQVKSLIEDGFKPEEIVWIEGFARSIRAETTI